MKDLMESSMETALSAKAGPLMETIAKHCETIAKHLGMPLSLARIGKAIHQKEELAMEQKNRDKAGPSKLLSVCLSLYLTFTDFLVY